MLRFAPPCDAVSRLSLALAEVDSMQSHSRHMWVYVYNYKSENLRNRTARHPPRLDWVLCAIRQQRLDNTMGLQVPPHFWWKRRVYSNQGRRMSQRLSKPMVLSSMLTICSCSIIPWACKWGRRGGFIQIKEGGCPSGYRTPPGNPVELQKLQK